MSYINDLTRLREALAKSVGNLDVIVEGLANERYTATEGAEAVRTISSRLWAVMNGETWEGSEESIKPWVDATKAG